MLWWVSFNALEVSLHALVGLFTLLAVNVFVVMQIYSYHACSHSQDIAPSFVSPPLCFPNVGSIDLIDSEDDPIFTTAASKKQSRSRCLHSAFFLTHTNRIIYSHSPLHRKRRTCSQEHFSVDENMAVRRFDQECFACVEAPVCSRSRARVKCLSNEDDDGWFEGYRHLEYLPQSK